MPNIISIVIPCFNEAANLPKLVQKLDILNKKLSNYKLEVIFVNDGSIDNTFDVLYHEIDGRPWITILGLTRNFGKEVALTAGLDMASGDAVIFMDGDLQHPPETVLKFVEHWEKGARIVLGKRINRDQDTPFYTTLATLFYKIHNKISDINVSPTTGDFRLIDKLVADQLRGLRENCRFMKGLFAWVGYDPEVVEYEVAIRKQGVSSFNKWRSWNLALEGITSFSTVPLRIWSYLGLLILSIGVLYAAWLIISVTMFGIDVSGYVTLITATIVFGGVQLIGIGVLGEYIGRIYLEVKNRPLYFIDKVVHGSD
jgi:glycosyltransferase involved in cell wall biosynthesis